jgi:type II secretory pathway pseudopilin PulG
MKALFHTTPLARSCATAGFTLVESVVALGIAGASLAAVMMVNSQQLRLVKSTRETNAASLCLEDRIEQLRIVSNWDELTSKSYLRDTFFSTVLKSGTPLGPYTESITVKAYLPEDTCTPLVVEKSKGKDAKVVSDGTGLDSLRLAEVDLQLRWPAEGRVRTRQYATVISNTGVSRFNLPAQGSAAGLPAMGSADQLPAAPAPVVTPTPTPTPVITPPVVVTPPVTGNGNGNGNSNPTGNVGGKSGKK